MSDRVDITPAAWLMPATFHAGILLAMLGRIVYFGPKFVKLFDEYGLVLPAWSRVVADVTRWASVYWAVALLGLAAVVLFNVVILWRLGGLSRRVGWLWTWMGGGLIFLLWVAVELGYLLPMWKLQEGLER